MGDHAEARAQHWRSQADGIAGWWTIGPSGAIGWRREIDGVLAPLPPGRGPGSLRPGAGWWPAEFRHNPATGHPLASARPPVAIEPGGWARLLRAGSGSARLVEPQPVDLPRGAAMFATGGHPARTVALDPGTGLASWWDPAARSWISLGSLAAPHAGRLLGTPDGVLLADAERLVWLIADHTDQPVPIAPDPPCAPSGPLLLHRRGQPHGPVAVWPSAADGGSLWMLALPDRLSAVAGRYGTPPQRLACPGLPADVRWGATICPQEDYALLIADGGFAVITSGRDGALRARWQGLPVDATALPWIGPWLQPNGHSVLFCRAPDGYLALSDRDGTARPIAALPSVLGPHAWRGTGYCGRDLWADLPAPVADGRWFLPLAGLGTDQLLGLRYDDILQQADVLNRADRTARAAELAIATPRAITPLGERLTIADPFALAVIPLGDRIAIANPGEGQCISFAIG